MNEGRAARISSYLLQSLLDLTVLSIGVLAGFKQAASPEQSQRFDAAVEQVYRGVVPVLLGRPLDASEAVQPLAFATGILLVLLSVRSALGTSIVFGLPDLEAI